MKLYNYELESVSKFLLNELELAGKANRMRMKFLKILDQKLIELREFQLQLLKEHCRLDENGNPKMTENKYEIIDINAFNKDFNELSKEEIVIEESEENRVMLIILRDALLDNPKTYKGEEAIFADRTIEIFEDIYKD